MKDNDKFLKPVTGATVPMPMKPGKGDEKPGAFLKPLPVKPGKPSYKPVRPGKPSYKPVTPRPVGSSGAMTKPAIKPGTPQAAAREAQMRIETEKRKQAEKLQSAQQSATKPAAQIAAVQNAIAAARKQQASR